jgi:hypothetical protein
MVSLRSELLARFGEKTGARTSNRFFFFFGIKRLFFGPVPTYTIRLSLFVTETCIDDLKSTLVGLIFVPASFIEFQGSGGGAHHCPRRSMVENLRR